MAIIVFSPHPYDETLGCGSTIAKKMREGYEVLIVALESLTHRREILADTYYVNLANVFVPDGANFRIEMRDLL